MDLSNDAVSSLLNTPEGRRAIAKESREFFVSYYLGLDIPKCHEPWYNVLNRKRHHQEAPRDHGKTTVFGYGYPLWAICNIENVRILLISKTGPPKGISTKLYDAILDELKNNERIIEDYGNLIVRERGGALFCKRTRRGIKDPTLESIGVMGAVTGGHYDIIIADDIIDDKNSRTANMRKQIDDWFKGTLMELLEPDSQILVIGTRKHWDDQYERLIENKMWTVGVDVAIIKYPPNYEYVEDENGQVIDVKIEGESEVLWPEKWNIKTLLMNRYDIGSIMFNREKMNDPSGMQGKILNAKWIKYFKENELPNDCLIYQGVDLAISEENMKGGDYVAITTTAYSPSQQKIYVIDMWRGHKTFPEQIGIIETYATMWAPTRITIESNNYQNAMIQFQNAINMLPIVGSPTTKDKVSRMLAVAPHLENGKILFQEDLPYWDDWLDEYTQFPDGATDDMLDSLEICIRSIIGGGEIFIGDFVSKETYIPVGETEWFS